MDELAKELKVEIFTFCDNASKKGGSLSITGTFENWTAKEFPADFPDFCIAIRIRLPRTLPVVLCQLLILNPDGDLMLKPLDLKVTAPVWTAVVTNRNVKLPKEGTYRAVLYADKQVVASLPLFIKCAPVPGEVLEGHLN
ncbi:MAG: hypothetical protein P1V20_05415 [Verrucomicrobiales bacterium]|nr:hypothetical protein [Verrucomicrobiales bacterium]